MNFGFFETPERKLSSYESGVRKRVAEIMRRCSFRHHNVFPLYILELLEREKILATRLKENATRIGHFRNFLIFPSFPSVISHFTVDFCSALFLKFWRRLWVISRNAPGTNKDDRFTDAWLQDVMEIVTWNRNFKCQFPRNCCLNSHRIIGITQGEVGLAWFIARWTGLSASWFWSMSADGDPAGNWHKLGTGPYRIKPD